MDTSSITAQEAFTTLAIILLSMGVIALCYYLGTMVGQWWFMTK